MLPAAKISDEIAEIRGIPRDRDCASPSRHTAFRDVDSMLDLVEEIAAATGLPVGIKSAVGHDMIWRDLVAAMTADRGRGVDFITIDGGEGGTGAAPLVFTDSVAFPFRVGFSRVYARFAEAGLTDDVVFVGSGKLGLPDNALVALALGADVLHVGREAMLAIGCIQAQKCHTDRCPTGVATQNRWLTSGLDPQRKAVRVANYLDTLRRDLVKVSEAVGVRHPGLIGGDDIELVDADRHGTPLREVFGYQPGWGTPGPQLRGEIDALMARLGTDEAPRPLWRSASGRTPLRAAGPGATPADPWGPAGPRVRARAGPGPGPPRSPGSPPRHGDAAGRAAPRRARGFRRASCGTPRRRGRRPRATGSPPR
nr:FMN-binding glutamate synthase family protein [Janibacter alkaliphilus]